MNRSMAYLLTIYSGMERDWMNYKINYNLKVPLTYHHIEKRENKGKTTIDNGALLVKKSHALLHTIEHDDIILYDELNLIFKIINEQREIPNEIQYKIIDQIINEYKERRNNNEYKRR